MNVRVARRMRTVVGERNKRIEGLDHLQEQDVEEVVRVVQMSVTLRSHRLSALLQRCSHRRSPARMIHTPHSQSQAVTKRLRMSLSTDEPKRKVKTVGAAFSELCITDSDLKKLEGNMESIDGHIRKL